MMWYLFLFKRKKVLSSHLNRDINKKIDNNSRDATMPKTAEMKFDFFALLIFS